MSEVERGDGRMEDWMSEVGRGDGRMEDWMSEVERGMEGWKMDE